MKRFFTLLGIITIGLVFEANAQDPEVVGISSATSEAGTKFTNDVIDIVVEFSEAVNVTAATLTLNSGGSATFGTGSGTKFITLNYTVGTDEYTTDLNYDNVGSLTGTITAVDNAAAANLDLTTLANGSLADNNEFVVDSRTRTIQSVTANTTNTGTYSAIGTIIDITVVYNHPVYVTGKPILYLNTENAGVYASYLSGTGGTDLTFRYTLASGDQTVYGDTLDYIATNSLNPNGGSIAYPSGDDVDLTLPDLSAGNSIVEGQDKLIRIDAQKPTVLSVSATSGSTNPLIVGESATITVRFSEPVAITAATDADKPRLLLETGDVDTLLAGVQNLTLSTTHSFTYDVSNGEESDLLNYKARNSFSIGGAGTIKDFAGNDAILTLPSTTSDSSLAFSNFVIDGIPPTIENITSSSANGSYMEGDSVQIKCTFSELVNSSGLTLSFDFNSTVAAIPVVVPDLSTANTYSFYYAIGATDIEVDTLDLESVSVAGTFTDTSGNIFSTAIPKGDSVQGALAKNKRITVDKSPATVDSIYVAADSTYGVNKTVLIGVKFSEAVKVTGSPKIQLNPNDTTAFAVYSSGSSRDSLIFKYRVLEGHTAALLDILDDTTTIDLSSGTLTDLAGNNQTYALPNPGGDGSISNDQSVKIDGVNPTIVDIVGDATHYDINGDGKANAGDTVLISIEFTKGLVVENTPRLLLETGTRDRYAYFSKLNANPAIAEFKYAVQVGDTTSLLDVKTSVSLVSGTIKDSLGNPVDRTITLGVLATDNIVVDGISPTIKNVISTVKNGTYNETADDIDISLVFSEPININSDPSLILNLNSGGATTIHNATTVSAIDTLHLTYSILDTENATDLDYTTLVFAGGTSITDENGNAFVATAIPTPGTTGSLGRNKAIIIDTDEPSLDSVWCGMDGGIYTIGDNLYFTLHFAEKVYVRGKPKIEMNAVYGTTNDSAVYYSGSGSNKIRFRYNVKEGYESTDLNYTSNTALVFTANDSIYDKAGNKFDSALYVPGVNGMLENDADDLVIDGVKPTISDITAVFDPLYDYLSNTKGNENDTIIISVVFSENVVLSGTPRLALETGRIDRYATFTELTGGNTLKFKYGVQAGDESDSLNVKHTRALIGGIKDVAGNYAVKTTPTTGTSLIDDKIVVDAIAPEVKKVTSTTGNGYKITGANINVRVEFTEVVDAASNSLELQLGSGLVGTSNLTGGTVNVLNNKLVDFTYVVVANDENHDLNYADTGSLTGAISDTNGNTAILTLPLLTSSYSLAGNKNLYIDAKAPSFVAASTPNAAGTYGNGSSVYIKLKYNDKVKVSGKPYFKVNSGTDAYAYYYSGSGTNTLQFKYVVSETDNTATLTIDSGINFVTTGSIKDYAGNETVYATINGEPLDKNIEIDGNSKSAEITNAIVTNINSTSKNFKEQVKVYPNPVKNSNIDIYFNDISGIGTVNIKIFDILGNLVISKDHSISGIISLENNFESGIYILTVSKGSDVVTNRLIIE